MVLDPDPTQIITNAIQNFGKDISHHRSAAELCSKDVNACAHVLGEVSSHIDTAIRKFRDLNSVKASDLERNSDDVMLSVKYIKFLRILCLVCSMNGTDTSVPRDQFLSIIVPLARLIEYTPSDSDVFSASEAALHALLHLFTSSCSYERLRGLRSDIGNSASVRNELWQILKTVITESRDKSSEVKKTAAFSVWLKWFDVQEVQPFASGLIELGPNQELLRCDKSYWHLLQTGLLHGSSNRRKTCLQILSESIQRLHCEVFNEVFVFRPKEKELIAAQFARYRFLFEAISLGRYINQVEECLPYLNWTMSKDSHVHPSWVLVLLQAAFEPSSTEGIRKFVANWYMRGQPDTFPPSKHHLDFLLLSFLPWAMQGTHFTSSFRARDSNADATVSCEHGELLSSCIRGLIQALPDDGFIQLYVSELLLYLCEHGFVHGVAFVLHGIAEALEKRPSWLNRKHVETLIKISERDGYPDVARRAITADCSRLCEIATNHLEDLSTTIGYRALRDRWLKIYHEADGVEIPDRSLLSEEKGPCLTVLVAELEKTKYQCLSGPNLITCYKFISDFLDASEGSLEPANNLEVLHKSKYALGEHSRETKAELPEHQPEITPSDLKSKSQDSDGLDEVHNLFIVVDAVWNEMEIQDYPKRALMDTPSIFLHPVCLSQSMRSSKSAISLRSLLSDILLAMQKICQTRIYAFPPLAAAMRAAYLSNPEVASILPLGKFFVEFANHPPTTKNDFYLEAAVAPLLTARVPRVSFQTYYGVDKSYGFACMFDMLNRLRPEEFKLAQGTLETLLKPWMEQNTPVPTWSKWKTALQLQTMLILVDVVIPSAQLNQGLRLAYLMHFHKLVDIEPLPRYRYLLEWIVIRFYANFPRLRDDLFSRLSTSDHHQPRAIAALIRISALVTCLSDSSPESLLSVITALVAMSASPRIAVRHESQWYFPRLWDHAESKGWVKITSNPALVALNNHIRQLDKYSKPPPERLIDFENHELDHSMTNLVEGGYMGLAPPEAPLAKRQDFQMVWERDAVVLGRWNQRMPPLRIPLGEAFKTVSLPEQASKDAAPAVTKTADSSIGVPLQTKSLLPSTFSALSPDFGHEFEPKFSARPTPVLVIGSLIDAAYNLGGLSRVSEIFGAAALHVNSLDVLRSKDFTSVAVSSERHLPIQELQKDAVRDFLLEKKADGYVVVGLEQTDQSYVLGGGEEERAAKLPFRTVLVIGSEKEGIPAKLLAECDMCVEIKQVGVTRSMNVQTAAAVALYEWSRQHFRGS
ncbi:hypothetical protein BDY21DRAFT_355334 [Lineolata rhizophorae]|uniref:tRNA/rRNA methyltransferase SpoU type domain-containing protein n=1 Tax=Lineolata rhizophorae TaxID=578093 RepID=A0A6A6NP93_9PEZI|nr:hypothetical protein BDY21DRAFT_355334 [Lineolata rhizophorae]